MGRSQRGLLGHAALLPSLKRAMVLQIGLSTPSWDECAAAVKLAGPAWETNNYSTQSPLCSGSAGCLGVCVLYLTLRWPCSALASSLQYANSAAVAATPYGSPPSPPWPSPAFSSTVLDIYIHPLRHFASSVKFCNFILSV